MDRRAAKMSVWALGLLATVALAADLAAQGPVAPAPLAASAAVAIDREALERELVEVRAQQAQLQQAVAEPTDLPLIEEQRHLVARLAVLLAAQLQPKAAVSMEALAAAPPPLGAPPYASAAVDALRDRLDAIADQRRSLDLSLRSLDSQVAGLAAARRKAEEKVRLRQDQLAQPHESSQRERLQAELAVARLEARIVGLELARADSARAEARERGATVSALLEPLKRDLDRVRPHQRIDDAALQQVANSVRAAQRQLQADRLRASAQLTRAEAAAVSAPADAALSREIAALRSELAALGELDPIEAGREEIWRQRRLALDSIADEEKREQVSAVISRSIDQLSARAQATASRLAQLRAVLRTERLRVDALPAQDAGLATERRALEARQREADLLETGQERLLRLQRLLERSLEDLGAATSDAPGPWPQRLGAWVMEAAQAVWRYELFSVSESTQVEGRTVILDYGVTVGKSIGVVLLFFVGWWFASRFSGGVIGFAVRRFQLSPQVGRVMHRWVLTVLLFGVLVVVLKLARIPLTAFAVMGGALAIGVGFGTQNIIKNLISGVIILFERKVRVGDIVTIDGVSGTVSSVDLRATTLQGFDGIEAIVPNSQLLENRVSNWSYGSPTVRRAIDVGLRYGDDARAAAACMLACARADAAVLPEPAPEALFVEFGSDAQGLRLQYWMRLGGPRAGPAVDSDLRHAITEAFAAHGFVIAFPQRDVHVRLASGAGPASVDAAVRTLGAERT